MTTIMCKYSISKVINMVPKEQTTHTVPGAHAVRTNFPFAH